MTTKKFFGYIFIGLSIVLTLSVIGQLPEILRVLLEFFRLFTGTLDSYQVGKVFGNISFWILYFSAIICLYGYGIKWTKKTNPLNRKLILTTKHIEFENDCRKMFVGQTIRGVIYGEVKYSTDEVITKSNIDSYYKTKYADIDTLDHSIYFKTDYKTINVFWDNTFVCYGLLSKQIDLAESTNDYEQKWDVSSDNKWRELIGQKIIAFNIIWGELSTSNQDVTNSTYTSYPQTFEIKTDNGGTIIISASEFNPDKENEIYPFMDNLLVTTNIDLARQLKLIE